MRQKRRAALSNEYRPSPRESIGTNFLWIVRETWEELAGGIARHETAGTRAASLKKMQPERSSLRLRERLSQRQIG